MCSTVLAAADAPDHVPGRLIIGMRAGADTATASRTLQLHRALIKKQLPELRASIVDVPEESSGAIIESLRQTGLYEYVERDYYAHTATTPNDPQYGSQWHLPQIKAPQAWALTTGSSSIIIAVIDSGVDATHPELAPKLVPGWNFVSNSATIVDNVGHGTAVAGVAAAASNNGLEVTGVSWASMIMPLVVVDPTDYASYSNIASAIQYAADNGARVINLSVGGSSPSAILQNAVNYAWGKGVVLFASAMNNSTSTPYYPAACSNVVAVSATDSTDNLASFSNYGSWITMAAPGTNILTTTVGGGTGYWYGTSFSSPIAAGVAALALSINPALTNSALVTLMEQNTDDLGAPGFDNSFGWGRVNAYKTVTAAQATLSPVTVKVSPSSTTLTAGQSVQLSATVTGSSGTVAWSLASGAGTISATGLYTAPASIAVTQTATVAATVAGVSASASIVLNPPPVTVSVAPATATLSAGQSVQLTANVGGTASAVAWSLNPAVGTISSNGLYTAPAAISAVQTVTAIATVAGVSQSSILTLNPPVTTTSIFTPIRVNAGGSSYVDSLGQTWSADNGYSGGYTWGVSNTFSGTTTQPLYQTCRYGAFSYQFAVPNGTYTVNLKFGELSQNGPGQRLFNVALNGTSALAGFDIFAQAGGEFIALTKSFTVSVTNGQINIQFTNGVANLPMVNAIEILAASTAPPASTAFAPIRVNAGGAAYTDSLGQTWSTDQSFSNGYTWSVSNTFSGTTAQPLYQSCRYGTFSYLFSVPNGTYTVNLKFAELSQTAAGRRQFNVGINGATVLTNFDIFAQAGGEFIVLDKPFTVSVTNGQIAIQFSNGAANLPMVNAIEILANSTSTGSTFSPVRVNGGGPSLVDSLSQNWSADQSSTGGFTWATSNMIAGTATPALYQTCRYGASFSYQFAIPNGTYTVNLKFAEISQTAAGQRQFNVAINGTPVLTNFDIFAQAGGAFTALDRPFSVSVTDGQLNIQFSTGTANLPMISAIEIIGGGSTGAVTARSGPMHYTR